MSEEKQTVADETDAQVKPDAEEQGAPETTESESLDELLAEFQKTEEPSQPEQKEQPKSDPNDALAKEVAELRQQIVADKERDALNKVIPDIRGDLPSDTFDDEMVEVWVRLRATQDKRIDEAWGQRDSNPKAFEKVVQGLGREFAKKFGKAVAKDEAATADKEAVAHAVRGQTKPAPESGEPNWGAMTPDEKRAYTKKHYGFTHPL